ncbi:hypothetical protein GCM10010489_27210 [Microbacterium saperdae]|nr:hypothetical protein GCM10010489_27210 [Microbacterium saperdae]
MRTVYPTRMGTPILQRTTHGSQSPAAFSLSPPPVADPYVASSTASSRRRSLVNGDRAPIRAPKPTRYEADHPGDLVHVDIKRLGRLPNGGGHRVLGRQAGARNNRSNGSGYADLRHAVDDHSRVAYSEILDDEQKETGAAFWRRAEGLFLCQWNPGVGRYDRKRLLLLLTRFAAALNRVNHRRTKPYRPQSDGKVERFNRTLALEWAYATSYASGEARAAAYDTWLHHNNHHGPHTGVNGQTPSDRVHNVPGNWA